MISAVDIMGGHCVQLIGGDARKKRIELEDPIQTAKDFAEKGARYMHVIDLDCALDRGDNHECVLDIIKELDIPVQVGGGIRTHEKVDLFLDNGAGKVIVGTQAILDTDWLELMTRGHPKKVIVAVDTRGEEILIKGWQAGSGKNLFEYAEKVDGLNLAGFLFTNVVLEGRLLGTDIKIVKKLVDKVKTPVIAAGGISTMDDLAHLEEIGVSGAIVGSAIYEGKLDFEKAVKRFQK